MSLSSPKMRVLLVAESANPEFVSVPLVGWSLSSALAQRCHAIIATQVRNREAFLRSGMQEHRDFVCINSEWLAKPLYKVNRVLRRAGLGWTATTAMASLAYYAFERSLCQQFRERLMGGEFDVVHRVTPLSPTIPSFYLSQLCAEAKVPFVLGPLNGGVPWPKEFRSALRAEGEWLSYVRSAYKLLPGYGRTLETAAAILVGSQDTLKQVPLRHHAKCFYVAENAIDPERFSLQSPQFSEFPIRVAFAGRLVPYKGADMMLESLADLIRSGRVVVNIYGDGPERANLEAFCQREQIAHGVEFHGWVKHSQLQGKLASNHLFVFPSIREFGGAVVLEAMALGVVPVVVGYGGPGELVTEDTGFAVPMGPRSQIVSDVRAAVTMVANHPDTLSTMREAGLERIRQHFTWDAKARKIMRVYRWTTGDWDIKPDTESSFSSLVPKPGPSANLSFGS